MASTQRSQVADQPLFLCSTLLRVLVPVIERKDIQVVICGTVDHWHTLISLAALRSKKDVYCEKPLTLTIEEGQHLVSAVRYTGGILQTGSQQRSDKNLDWRANLWVTVALENCSTYLSGCHPGDGKARSRSRPLPLV